MPGYWIKVEHLLPDKPEVHSIATELGIAPDAVVGKLVRVWIWADQQLDSGNAVGVTLALLDSVAGAVGFGAAMQSAGWLTATRRGFSFPHFERHNGETSKKRALTSIRVMRNRNADGVTNLLPKKEKEKEKKKEPPTPSENEPKSSQKSSEPSSAALPAALDTPAFRLAWADWYRYRAERQQPLTPSGAARLLKNLAQVGAARACALIDRSIANGYAGLIFTEDRQHEGERVGGSDPPPGKYDGIAQRIVCGADPPAGPPEGLAAGEGAGGGHD